MMGLMLSGSSSSTRSARYTVPNPPVASFFPMRMFSCSTCQLSAWPWRQAVDTVRRNCFLLLSLKRSFAHLSVHFIICEPLPLVQNIIVNCTRQHSCSTITARALVILCNKGCCQLAWQTSVWRPRAPYLAWQTGRQ